MKLYQLIGLLIDFVVVHIALLNDTNTGFDVYDNDPGRTLRSACGYISTLRDPVESSKKHFDFGVALTRKPFGPSGNILS